MAKIAVSHTSSSFLNNFFVPKLNEKGKFFFRQQLIVKSQIIDNATTYTCRISTDIPLYENPRACFDRYLENKPRVFKAIFPDKRRSHQLNQALNHEDRHLLFLYTSEECSSANKDIGVLSRSHVSSTSGRSLSNSAVRLSCFVASPLQGNQEEWRIHMLPIEFLLITVFPVIDMRLRCKTRGVEYPPGVPNTVSKVLELDIIRWELQGLDDVLKPSEFSLGVKGSLYPDRNGPRTRLKGQLQMSISFVLPHVLALVPEAVRRDVAESVLRGLLQNMKSKVNGSLLTDYAEFKREMQNNLLV